MVVLYVPETIPQMSHDDIAALAGKSYEEIAFAVMRPFIGDTFTDTEFQSEIIAKPIARSAIQHARRLVQLDNNHFLLELFHGPTLGVQRLCNAADWSIVSSGANPSGSCDHRRRNQWRYGVGRD